MGSPDRVANHQSAVAADVNQAIGEAERIWQVVAQIPTGRVISYGDVAQRAGLPGYARFVGTTLGKLPKDTGLPWHRVVNASRKIAQGAAAEWVNKNAVYAPKALSLTGTP